MRNILHAWGIAICKDILTKAKVGMTNNSVLLIDEIVLPERNATVQGAEHDIEVMVCVGKQYSFLVFLPSCLRHLSGAVLMVFCL